MSQEYKIKMDGWKKRGYTEEEIYPERRAWIIQRHKRNTPN